MRLISPVPVRVILHSSAASTVYRSASRCARRMAQNRQGESPRIPSPRRRSTRPFLSITMSLVLYHVLVRRSETNHISSPPSHFSLLATLVPGSEARPSSRSRIISFPPYPLPLLIGVSLHLYLPGIPPCRPTRTLNPYTTSPDYTTCCCRSIQPTSSRRMLVLWPLYCPSIQFMLEGHSVSNVPAQRA